MKPLNSLLLRQLAIGESATIVRLDVDHDLQKRLVALGMRVGFSIALFLLLLRANQMGWIHSTGVPVRPGA